MADQTEATSESIHSDGVIVCLTMTEDKEVCPIAQENWIYL